MGWPCLDMDDGPICYLPIYLYALCRVLLFNFLFRNFYIFSILSLQLESEELCYLERINNNMPKKASGNFDQMEYIAEWKSKNMKSVNSSFKSDFVDEFRASCKILGLKQADIIRNAMQETIDKAKKTSE